MVKTVNGIHVKYNISYSIVQHINAIQSTSNMIYLIGLIR